MARHDIAQGARAQRTPRAQKAQEKQGGALQTVLNILGVILCVLFIPIIILNVVMIVRSYTDPNHIPSVFGYSPVIVLSGSMSPEFETGDMIFIQKTDPATLQVGDVICFMEEETAVTHRIMDILQQDGETMYITQGDANNMEDSTPVMPQQVQGKYTGFYISGLGYFADWLQSTPGMLIFIGGPIILFLLWDIFRRMIQSRKSDKETQKLQAESSSKEQEMAAMEEELRQLRAKVGQSAPEEYTPAPRDSTAARSGHTSVDPGYAPLEQEFAPAEPQDDRENEDDPLA